MTSTAAPADEQVSEILARPRPRPRPRRWRRIAGWSIAVLLVATAIGIPLWWRSAAGSMQLQEGSYSTAPGAWSIEAGPVREECFGIVPGSTLKFGISFDNNNSRPIHLTKVDPPLEIVDGAIRGNVQGTIVPLDDGARSRVMIALELVGYRIGKLLVPLVVRSQARKEIPTNLRNLKQRLENGA